MSRGVDPYLTGYTEFGEELIIVNNVLTVTSNITTITVVPPASSKCGTVMLYLV